MKIAIIGGGAGMSRCAMMLEAEARQQGIEVTTEKWTEVRGHTVITTIIDKGYCISGYEDSKPKEKWQGQGKRKKGRIK